MPKAKSSEVIRQIEVVLKAWKRKKNSLVLEETQTEATRLSNMLADIILRFAPPKSAFMESYRETFRVDGLNSERAVHALAGVVAALKESYMNGLDQTFQELVRGETFSDFLDMATHLLGEGYKDAAAVIAGSTLEGHLKHLATNRNLLLLDAKGNPKKATLLNDELRAAGTYGNLDHKSIGAWLDLRNKAAHAEYEKYGASQVGLLISGVRDYVARVPS